MNLQVRAVLSALVIGMGGVAAHADTTVTFNLNSGSYLPITATFPDTFTIFNDGSPNLVSQPVTETVGTQSMVTYLGFTNSSLYFNSHDTIIDSSEQIFDGASFLPGTYSAELSNDYPMQLTGIPEGNALPGTLVVTNTTPEPSSLLLLGTGALGACAGLRRRWASRG